MNEIPRKQRLVIPALSLFVALAGGSALGCAGAGDPDEPLAAAESALQPSDADRTWNFTIQSAPHYPQDVWIAAHGSNTDGWNSGGSVCLGLLANSDGPTDPTPAFLPGDHATLLTTVLEAGVYGVDGLPVPPGDYVAPNVAADAAEPPYPFTLTEGQYFYTIFDGEVINSSEPAGYPAPVGTITRFMFTFELPGEGRQIVRAALWLGLPTGGGSYFYFPIINEGTMMINARSR